MRIITRRNNPGRSILLAPGHNSILNKIPMTRIDSEIPKTNDPMSLFLLRFRYESFLKISLNLIPLKSSIPK